MPTSPPAVTTSIDAVSTVDSRFLRTLLGYNTRRATVFILDLFTRRMQALDLRPVEFSILSLIGRNPGVTPSQLCAELNLLAPNLAKMLARLDKRELITRTPVPNDKRAVHLSLNATGHHLLEEAERTVVQLEAEAASALTPEELQTLMGLLQKIY